MGRRALPPGKKKIQSQFAILPAFDEKLKVLAAERQITKSQLIANIIEEWLDRQANEKGAGDEGIDSDASSSSGTGNSGQFVPTLVTHDTDT